MLVDTKEKQDMLTQAIIVLESQYIAEKAGFTKDMTPQDLVEAMDAEGYEWDGEFWVKV